MAPQFTPMTPAATALVATSVIVTSILVSVISALYSRRVKRGRGQPAATSGDRASGGETAGADRIIP